MHTAQLPLLARNANTPCTKIGREAHLHGVVTNSPGEVRRGCLGHGGCGRVEPSLVVQLQALVDKCAVDAQRRLHLGQLVRHHLGTGGAWGSAQRGGGAGGAAGLSSQQVDVATRWEEGGGAACGGGASRLLGDERFAKGDALVAPGAGGLEGVLGPCLTVHRNDEPLLRRAERGGGERDEGKGGECEEHSAHCRDGTRAADMRTDAPGLGWPSRSLPQGPMRQGRFWLQQVRACCRTEARDRSVEAGQRSGRLSGRRRTCGSSSIRYLKPRPSSPSSASAGSRTSSKKSSHVSCVQGLNGLDAKEYVFGKYSRRGGCSILPAP